DQEDAAEDRQPERLREELAVPRTLFRRQHAGAGNQRRQALQGELQQMIARAARLLFSLAAAAAVLALGAYAGGAFAPAQAAKGRPARASDEQRYDKEPEAGEIAVGDALSVMGQPMQLSIFFTSDEPRRVIAFYADAFRARGLTPVLTEVHVSAFDPKDGWQR